MRLQKSKSKSSHFDLIEKNLKTKLTLIQFPMQRWGRVKVTRIVGYIGGSELLHDRRKTSK